MTWWKFNLLSASLESCDFLATANRYKYERCATFSRTWYVGSTSSVFRMRMPRFVWLNCLFNACVKWSGSYGRPTLLSRSTCNVVWSAWTPASVLKLAIKKQIKTLSMWNCCTDCNKLPAGCFNLKLVGWLQTTQCKFNSALNSWSIVDIIIRRDSGHTSAIWRSENEDVMDLNALLQKYTLLYNWLHFFLLEMGSNVRKMYQVTIHGGNYDDSTKQMRLPGHLSFCI